MKKHTVKLAHKAFALNVGFTCENMRLRTVTYVGSDVPTMQICGEDIAIAIATVTPELHVDEKRDTLHYCGFSVEPTLENLSIISEHSHCPVGQWATARAVLAYGDLEDLDILTDIDCMKWLDASDEEDRVILERLCELSATSPLRKEAEMRLGAYEQAKAEEQRVFDELSTLFANSQPMSELT